VQRAVARIAETDCPVLILGEHGAGKRYIAGQIHAQSHLSRGAVTEIQCGDTDAQALLAALSINGTVYLNEITDLSLSLSGTDHRYLLPLRANAKLPLVVWFEPRTSGKK